MFIGRNDELEFLEERLRSSKFEMIPIYGRRRVGKTRLLEEFIKDKKTIFFTADQFSDVSNLEGLSWTITRTIHQSNVETSFSSFQDAFEAVAECARENKEPLVFIIDEYPYLSENTQGIASVLQRTIDKEYLHLPNLMLILTGSQTSFMEQQVMGYRSPLYGRRTGQIKLRPLDFGDARKFLPQMDITDFLTIYGITGGIPLYLSIMNDDLTLEDNIKKNLLTQNTLLYEEPYNLLLQELRNPNRYNEILSSIANGKNKLNEIADRLDIESGTLSKYIDVLMELDIIEKREPLIKTSKRKTIYYIKDGLFHFWYRYVPKYRTFIERKQLENLWPKIEEDLIQFTSLIFEDFCRDWVLRLNDPLVREAGGWWGNNPLIKNSKANAEEIDVIGLGLEDDELVIGECKWRNEDTGLKVGEKLIERAEFFPHDKKYLYIFSKSDFSEGLKEYAENHKIQLITYEEMVKKYE